MSINDSVEMTIFLCLMFFHFLPKCKVFVYEYFMTEIQDDCQKWQENNFWEKSPIDSTNTLKVKHFVEITLSHTVSEINVFLHFMQKFIFLLYVHKYCVK